jgi:hypothetical protein
LGLEPFAIPQEQIGALALGDILQCPHHPTDCALGRDACRLGDNDIVAGSIRIRYDAFVRLYPALLHQLDIGLMGVFCQIVGIDLDAGSADDLRPRHAKIRFVGSVTCLIGTLRVFHIDWDGDGVEDGTHITCHLAGR